MPDKSRKALSFAEALTQSLLMFCGAGKNVTCENDHFCDRACDDIDLFVQMQKQMNCRI